LHVGCSTAIQALNYGIPSGYINISKKFFRNNLPSKVSYNLNTQKKIIEFCNKTEKFKLIRKIDSINLNASRNIISQIKKLKPKKGESNKISSSIIVKDYVDEYKWFLKKFIIKMINSKKLMNNLSMTSPVHQKLMGGIKKDEVYYYLKKISHEKIKIKKVLINCFEIDF